MEVRYLHTMVRVLDLDATMRFFGLLGLREIRRIDNDKGRFSLVFIPVPFVLVLLRLEIEAWHYYLFGAAYIGLSALLYVIDGRASHRCDAAERLAEEAQRAADAAALTPAS